MLIIKFEINYLVFIRSMREGNLKLFVKILVSLVKWFSIFLNYQIPEDLSTNDHLQCLSKFLRLQNIISLVLALCNKVVQSQSRFFKPVSAHISSITTERMVADDTQCCGILTDYVYLNLTELQERMCYTSVLVTTHEFYLYLYTNDTW